jgi:hypothetical protein
VGHREKETCIAHGAERIAERQGARGQGEEEKSRGQRAESIGKRGTHSAWRRAHSEGSQKSRAQVVSRKGKGHRAGQGG